MGTDTLTPTATTAPTLATGSLTLAERDRWLDQGWLGPFTLASVEEMAAMRARIDRDIFIAQKDVVRSQRNHDRHLDHADVWAICSAPALIERVASLLGPDLLIWRSNFQEKRVGDPGVPWHQDAAYFGLQPAVMVSAWIAIDEATEANGCLRVVPGSHHALWRHRHDPSAEAFARALDDDAVDLAKAVPFCLKPGEFVLFNELTVHGSEANRTDRRRLGLTPRITVPFVRVPSLADGGRRAVAMVRGRDYTGLHRVMPPPR